MPLFLVSTEHPDSPVPLDKPVMMFGRQAECDVILTCSRKVSRRHCCVVQISNWFIVRDLGSTNGVSINGQKVKREGRLAPGDELSIGDVCFDFVESNYDVPKGKVCIGPPLKSQKKPARAAEEILPVDSAGEGRRRPPSGIAGRTQRTNDDDRLNENVEEVDAPLVPDDMIGETFGSDADFAEMNIEETFGSDIADSVEKFSAIPPVDLDRDQPANPKSERPTINDADDVLDSFAFLDDDDAEDVVAKDGDPQNAKAGDTFEPNTQEDERAPRRPRPAPYKPSRSPLPADDEQAARRQRSTDRDPQYDDEPPRRPKQRPEDQQLREDEQFDDEDVEVRRGGGGSGKVENMDSIIELDEFDLLD